MNTPATVLAFIVIFSGMALDGLIGITICHVKDRMPSIALFGLFITGMVGLSIFVGLFYHLTH